VRAIPIEAGDARLAVGEANGRQGWGPIWGSVTVGGIRGGGRGGCKGCIKSCSPKRWSLVLQLGIGVSAVKYSVLKVFFSPAHF
jgi:hypothetical protein